MLRVVSSRIRLLILLGAAGLAWLPPAVGPGPAGAQVTDADDIVLPPMPSVERPQPRRVELPNGMVVMLLEDHELPLVEARALIRTGSRWEPADQVGLATLTGQVLRSGGTTSIPSDELDDLLEDRAAVIETSISTVTGSAFMSCLVDDFAEMLGVFADVLRHPAFEEDKLAVAKTQMETSIARQNDNVNGILGREFRELIYGADSPYARRPTYATARGIGRDDLLAWHGRYFHPERIILGLVGDFESDEALELVRETFGDWPRGPAAEEPEAAIAGVEPGVYYVEKNDVNQSYIRLGHLGIRRDNPDYYAVEVMNHVLGGSFAARLFTRVRTQKGLAYSVFGSVQSRWDHPGLFLMSMSTKTETTGAGIEALLTEADNMTAEPPSDEEVEKAKAALLNSFVFLADSTGEILARQLTYERFGYPLDWLDRYRRGIERVTTAEVRAAAAKYIQPERFAILVVGPKEGADRPLSDFGEVATVDITIPEPEAPEVEVTEEGRRRAEELLAEAVAAIGGAERLAALTSLQLEASAEATSPQGPTQIRMKATFALPDRGRWEMTLPFGTMVQVLNGDASFVSTPRGTQPMPESQRAQLEADIRRLPLVLLSLRGREDFQAVAESLGEIDGTPVEWVRVELGGQASALGIDPETGRILSIEYRGRGFTGAPGDLRRVYSDFREIDGLVLPFAWVTTFNGEPMMNTVSDKLVVDGPVDDALFEMPEG